MLKHLIMSILLMGLLFAGCSSNTPKKTPLFSEELTAELQDIINRNMTDADWEKLQQKFDQLEKLANQDFDIDFKRDFDKNPWVLMAVIETSMDNPKFQEELSEFAKKMMPEILKTIKESKKVEQISEKERQKAHKQMEDIFKSVETK